MKLIEINDKSYECEENFQSGVIRYPSEKSYVLTELVRVNQEINKKYLLLIEGKLPYVAQEGTLEMNILSKKPEIQLEPVENLDPQEFYDKYVPTKYGIIFRERLFVNNEVQGSAYIRLANIVGSTQAAPVPQKGKKPVDAGPQFEETELKEQRLIKFELFRDDKLISFSFGYNQALLSNFNLFPTNDPKEARSYYLQASFDLREWPECKDVNEWT